MVPFDGKKINFNKSRTLTCFGSYHRFRGSHISKFVIMKISVTVMIYTFTVASFDGKYLSFYLIAIVMIALSYNIYDIRKTNVIPLG